MQHATEPYVLIPREIGGVLTLVRVPGAVPVSRGLVDVAEHLLDSLGAPPRHGEAPADGDRRDA